MTLEVRCLNNQTSITLYDSCGDDLKVVNAARASFDKSTDSFTDKDAKLIEYLAANRHMSPFRHVSVSLCINNIPEFVLRQLFRHQVGCGYTSDECRVIDMPWNEVSGRYVNLTTDFYLPLYLREQHDSNKQCSIKDSVIQNNDGMISEMHDCMVNSFRVYNRLIQAGVCREQARIVLPLSFKSSVFVTMTLEALVNFINLRVHSHAQVEMQEFASAVYEVTKDVAPISMSALLKAYDSKR